MHKQSCESISINNVTEIEAAEKFLVVPEKLNKGDMVRVVSPSSGVLGEPYVSHELERGIKNLNSLGLSVSFGSNTLFGKDFLANNPKARAADIKEAFSDDGVRAIIGAIGGDDTFRTIPVLLEDTDFINSVREHPKIFMGFSDATVNHLMFYKLGLMTYYGPSFLNDFAELDSTMLPYTEQSFLGMLGCCSDNKLRSSPIWYEERKDFSSSAVGTCRIKHEEKRGYERLYGSGMVSGRLLGGCVESLYELVSGERYPEQKYINEKYQIFPSCDEWKNTIMFLESSDEKPTPERLVTILHGLEAMGVFDVINGLIIGKPQDECYYEEYKQIYTALVEHYKIPALYNLNFGHSYPRCILPYGARVNLNMDEKTIEFTEPIVR